MKTIRVSPTENDNWEINRIHDFLEGKAIELENTDLIDKLVLLMIKAGINSEIYGIDIKESEIQSNIKRLMESGKIG
jgi:uncharacterized protein YqfA (UPF0365 family)